MILQLHRDLYKFTDSSVGGQYKTSDNMLGVIVASYREFSSRVELLTNHNLSKPERIKAVIKNTTGKITKAEIMAECPDISDITVQRALTEMMENGEIIKKVGAGIPNMYGIGIRKCK